MNLNSSELSGIVVCVCLVEFSCLGLGILSRQFSLTRTGIFPGGHDEGREERKSGYVMTDHNLSWPRREIRTQRLATTW